MVEKHKVRQILPLHDFCFKLRIHTAQKLGLYNKDDRGDCGRSAAQYNTVNFFLLDLVVSPDSPIIATVLVGSSIIQEFFSELTH